LICAWRGFWAIAGLTKPDEITKTPKILRPE
jgi:hypothetical protein